MSELHKVDRELLEWLADPPNRQIPKRFHAALYRMKLFGYVDQDDAGFYGLTDKGLARMRTPTDSENDS